jgi:predicted Zn-dependent protease
MLVAPYSYAIDDDLPDMGSPADSVLSKNEEQRIGRAIFRSLRDTGRVMDDPEIQEYIQNVGQKLSATAQEGDLKFQFFVVNDPAINAFALPGGYIGVHSGLILDTANESELAGVLAHEIAHVTQRHISRAIFANQRASILTMAAMLGAILVGALTGGGALVQGAMATAQGVTAQNQINFTRINEYEADRVGVGILADSGFDPMAMPAFFETMARRTGPLASQIPEFLRSHPVEVSRIAETRSRASEYPAADVTDSVGYALTRARLRVLTASTPEDALEIFDGQRINPETVADPGLEYGTALAMLGLGKYDEAADRFSQLLETNEGIIHYHTGLAIAQVSAGDVDAAFATLAEGLELFPRNVPLTLRYAEIEMRYGDPAVAHEVLLDLLNQVPPTPEQIRLIALAANAAGDVADAHYYMAEYHISTGSLQMAIDQLRLALGIPALDDVQRARFRARLEEMQEFLPAEQGGRRQSRNREGRGQR